MGWCVREQRRAKAIGSRRRVPRALNAVGQGKTATEITTRASEPCAAERVGVAERRISRVRALITGSSGFVGRHLAKLLRERGIEACGVDRTTVAADFSGSAVETRVGDVCDRSFMAHTVQEFEPSHVFHLAWTFNKGEKGGPGSIDNDVVAATVLFETVRAAGRRSWILLASSSAVYGCPAAQPIDEEAPLNPTTPYGVSKQLTEEAATEARRNHRINIVVTRTFNLIGPGVPQRLLPGSMASQIVAAENGGPRAIRVGRLDSSRDYLDVRDAVRAYVSLAERSINTPAVFNVCAGVSRTCRELADEMISAAKVPVELVHDTTRLQAGDIDFQQGVAARLEQATGWAPAIRFSRSVCDMLDLERATTQPR